jgi:hypothetical protein
VTSKKLNVTDFPTRYPVYDVQSNDIKIITIETDAEYKDFLGKTISIDTLYDIDNSNYKIILNNMINYFTYLLDINILNFNIGEYALSFNINKPLYIPVTIIGGRKHKNCQGVLLYGKAYYNMYNGITEYRPYIMLSTGELVTINSFNYLKYTTKWVNTINNYILSEELLKDDIINMFNKIVKNFIDINDDYIMHEIGESFSHVFENCLISKHYNDLINNIADEKYTKLVNTYIEEKHVEYAKFKETKMVDLINWVKTNTDKTGDEIYKLAEQIFNKRYPIKYE